MNRRGVYGDPWWSRLSEGQKQVLEIVFYVTCAYAGAKVTALVLDSMPFYGYLN